LVKTHVIKEFSKILENNQEKALQFLKYKYKCDDENNNGY
jgi:hypothetical protein